LHEKHWDFTKKNEWLFDHAESVASIQVNELIGLLFLGVNSDDANGRKSWFDPLIAQQILPVH